MVSNEYLDNLQSLLVTVRGVRYLVGWADNGKEFLHVVGDFLKWRLPIHHQVEDAAQGPYVRVPPNLGQLTEDGD